MLAMLARVRPASRSASRDCSAHGPHAAAAGHARTHAPGHHNATAAAAILTAAALAAAAALPPAAESSLAAAEPPFTIEPCKPRTPCVSTSSYLSPSNYLPPWSFAPDSPEHALQRLTQELQQLGGTIASASVDAAGGRVVARVPARAAAGGGVLAAPPLSGGGGVDELKLLLRRDGTVLFSSNSSSKLPDLPFCITPGCISGPLCRGRMEGLRDRLGWQVLETDEEKQWVQILLH